jgi:DNA invertase Pin-like site-specific DNA recombinase
VSTLDQQLGLGAQRHDIEVYAAAHDVEVIAWHEEVISGGTPFLNRPVLPQAIADLSVLDAYDLDGFNRRIKEFPDILTEFIEVNDF